MGDMRKTVGIIGFGNMGSAIAEQIKVKYQLFVFDKDKEKTRNLSGIGIADNILDLVNKVDTLILAVKPQDFDTALNEIKPYAKDKLVISIAAGITTAHMEKILGAVRVIRAMPNIPAKISEGITCFSKGRFASEEDLVFAQDLFVYLGETLRIDEEKMNAVTAVSGSGPGFLCDLIEGKSLTEIKDFTEKVFIPSFSATASSLGFTPMQAKILAEVTGRGSVRYLEKEHLSPAEMKKQVASKGGTTEAGLRLLQHNIKNLTEAAKAALRRAEELSKKE